MIPFFDIKITEDMINAASTALRNEKLVLGESVFKFEEEFAKYIGTKYAISVNSGTSALQLSIIALDLEKNSNILTSTNSFISSSNSILLADHKPVLADIFSNTGNINPNSVDVKFNAIIPVHIYGNPCNMEEILSIAEDKHIPIIEDAAQAHGATYKNQKVGKLGKIGCFSFYPTKNMTVGGDGGMVTTDDENIVKTIESLRDNGRITKTKHDKLGSTMRLNTVNAAIGRIQLKFLDSYNKKRKKIANFYRKKLNLDCLLDETPYGVSVYHQIVIRHKQRDAIMKHLEKSNIGSMIHYPVPIHKQPLYSKYNLSLPESELFCNEILSLPSFPLLTDEQMKIIVEKVNEVI
jgi:perosamine synthetase